MTIERRKFLRVPIDEPNFVTFSFRNGSNATLLLLDLSRGGLQSAFSPEFAFDKEQLLGKPVTIGQLPDVVLQTLEGRETVEGKVNWVSPQRCGVSFDVSLNIGDEELAALLDSL